MNQEPPWATIKISLTEEQADRLMSSLTNAGLRGTISKKPNDQDGFFVSVGVYPGEEKLLEKTAQAFFDS